MGEYFARGTSPSMAIAGLAAMSERTTKRHRHRVEYSERKFMARRDGLHCVGDTSSGRNRLEFSRAKSAPRAPWCAGGD